MQIIIQQELQKGKDFPKRFYFKDMKLPVKTRHIQEIEKNNSNSISVFRYKN